MHRTTVVRCVGALVTALVLAACAGEDAGKDAGGSPSPTSTPSSATPTRSPALSPSPTAVPTSSAPRPTFSITYAKGHVAGGTRRLKVAYRAKVSIQVTSDVADEVHLHGYDVMVDVAPGHPALLTFTAKLRGVYKIELEKLGKELARVQVQ
jgi:hypothetical protein